VVAGGGIAGITLVLIIIALSVLRRRQKSKDNVLFTNTDGINMYSSPAYGTHQVFSEPGMDHLYEPIDDGVLEKSTKLDDKLQDEIDSEGYLHMVKSDEASAQNGTTEDADEYLRMDGEQQDLQNEIPTIEVQDKERDDQFDINEDDGTTSCVLETTEDQQNDATDSRE